MTTALQMRMLAKVAKRLRHEPLRFCSWVEKLLKLSRRRHARRVRIVGWSLSEPKVRVRIIGGLDTIDAALSIDANTGKGTDWNTMRMKL